MVVCLFVCLVGWLFGWLVDWLVGWLVGSCVFFTEVIVTMCEYVCDWACVFVFIGGPFFSLLSFPSRVIMAMLMIRGFFSGPFRRKSFSVSLGK